VYSFRSTRAVAACRRCDHPVVACACGRVSLTVYTGTVRARLHVVGSPTAAAGELVLPVRVVYCVMFVLPFLPHCERWRACAYQRCVYRYQPTRLLVYVSLCLRPWLAFARLRPLPAFNTVRMCSPPVASSSPACAATTLQHRPAAAWLACPTRCVQQDTAAVAARGLAGVSVTCPKYVHWQFYDTRHRGSTFKTMHGVLTRGIIVIRAVERHRFVSVHHGTVRSSSG